MYIVVEGNPAQGFQYFGPFRTPEAAKRFADEEFAEEECWTAKLMPDLEDAISKQERGLAKLHELE
jgi:hypothetical protein